MLRSLLRIPLVLKVMGANGLIIALALVLVGNGLWGDDQGELVVVPGSELPPQCRQRLPRRQRPALPRFGHHRRPVDRSVLEMGCVRPTRFSNENLRLRQADLVGRVGPPAFNVQLSYIYIDNNLSGFDSLGSRQEVNLNVSSRLSEFWTIGTIFSRDLEPGKTRLYGGRLKYEDECFIFAIDAQRRLYRDNSCSLIRAWWFISCSSNSPGAAPRSIERQLLDWRAPRSGL